MTRRMLLANHNSAMPFEAPHVPRINRRAFLRRGGGDHQRLSFCLQSHDFRLTNVHGRVVQKILAGRD